MLVKIQALGRKLGLAAEWMQGAGCGLAGEMWAGGQSGGPGSRLEK